LPNNPQHLVSFEESNLGLLLMNYVRFEVFITAKNSSKGLLHC